MIAAAPWSHFIWGWFWSYVTPAVVAACYESYVDPHWVNPCTRSNSEQNLFGIQNLIKDKNQDNWFDLLIFHTTPPWLLQMQLFAWNARSAVNSLSVAWYDPNVMQTSRSICFGFIFTCQHNCANSWHPDASKWFSEPVVKLDLSWTAKKKPPSQHKRTSHLVIAV